MRTHASNAAWEELRAQLASAEEPGLITIPRRRGFPHPRDAGGRLTSTWPVGQIADYSIDGRPPLVVREFPDRWEAFVDDARLADRVLAAVDSDPASAMFVGAALLGGAVGSSMSNKREGMLLGAGLGLVLAAALSAALEDDRRRR